MSSFITTNETVEAEKWDLMDYDDEDDNDVAKGCKEVSIKSLRVAIKASGGAEKKSKSLLKKCARNPRSFKCHMAFLAFKLKQEPIKADGKTTKPYAGNEMDWNQEFSVNLSHIAQSKLNRDGIMAVEGMQAIFGKFVSTIQGPVKDLIIALIKETIEKINVAHPLSNGKRRADIVPDIIKIANCHCTFDTATEYNTHCEQIHGIITAAQEKDSTPISGAGDGNMGIVAAALDKMATGTSLAMNTMAMSGTHHNTLHRISSDPSKKDIEDALEELMTNLEAYAQIKPRAKEIPLQFHGMTKLRVFEIIDEG